MPDTPADPPSTGPIDNEVLARIAPHLSRSARFDDVQARPGYVPNAVVADYNLGYFPGRVSRAYLRIRWFETDAHCFCIHCETQVELDLDRDKKACPECRSNAVKTIDELVDEQCPVCEDGTFIAEDTGAIA